MIKTVAIAVIIFGSGYLVGLWQGMPVGQAIADNQQQIAQNQQEVLTAVSGVNCLSVRALEATRAMAIVASLDNNPEDAKQLLEWLIKDAEKRLELMK